MAAVNSLKWVDWVVDRGVMDSENERAYLDAMATLERRERAGDDVSFERWIAEFAVNSTNLMKLAADMAKALGPEHPLTVKFHTWGHEAVKLVPSAPF
jgi:hypothetical protein